MRFFEVANQQRNVIATKRFRQEAAKFCRGYPGLDRVISDFIMHRSVQNSAPWKKDAPFAGGDKNVRGLWHVHFYHGKVIGIYDVTPTELRLITVCEHSEFDTPKAVQTLGKYYRSLTADDFSPYQVSTEAAAPQLTADERSEISNLMYELASGSEEDRAILVQVASGNSTGFLQWAQMLIQDAMSPTQKDEAVMAAFGGQPGLAASAARVLKELGLSESAQFVRPNQQETHREHEEVHYQLNHHQADHPEWVNDHLHQLKDRKAFYKAVRNGKVYNVSPSAARAINNTGDHHMDVRKDGQAHKMARVQKQFNSPGTQITTPIVLHNKATGERHLLAGHHRLTHNSQVLGKNTQVLHLEYPSRDTH
jgi:hypothetical protein